MAQYVTKVRTEFGDSQIDYNALANLPTINGKALSGDFKLSASDIDASAGDHTHNYAASSNAGGSANAAVKLETARAIQTNLSSTDAQSFDGSGDIMPGITGTLAVEHGGTDATTRAEASQNINVIGLNPIASVENDTIAQWIELGNGIAYCNKADALSNQPSANGFIENIVYDDTVYQTFYTIGNNPKTYHRAGQVGTGWNSEFTDFGLSGVLKLKQVWYNLSHASEFPGGQTIHLSSDKLNGVDFWIVCFKILNSHDSARFCEVVSSQGGGFRACRSVYGTNVAVCQRQINFDESDVHTWSFEDCTVNGVVDNNNLIPVAIWAAYKNQEETVY